jgi:isoquinoline 1-oxidoreductase beta subunit
MGHMVNPDTVEAQLQSSIIFGMGAVLKHQITMTNGRVQQANYDSFAPVRFFEAPKIDIVLVKSSEAPGGIGEPATAVVAPAIANAVAQLTGKRVRRLPITAEALKQTAAA